MLHKGGISTHYATAGADLPSQAEKQPSSAVQLPITATLHAEYLTLFIRIIQHLSANVNSNFFESQISILYYRKKCKSHVSKKMSGRGIDPPADFAQAKSVAARRNLFSFVKTEKHCFSAGGSLPRPYRVSTNGFSGCLQSEIPSEFLR